MAADFPVLQRRLHDMAKIVLTNAATMISINSLTTVNICGDSRRLMP